MTKVFKNLKFVKRKVALADILVIVLSISVIFLIILLHLDWTRLL
jgi:hypothetical protein